MNINEARNTLKLNKSISEESRDTVLKALGGICDYINNSGLNRIIDNEKFLQLIEELDFTTTSEMDDSLKTMLKDAGRNCRVSS